MDPINFRNFKAADFTSLGELLFPDFSSESSRESSPLPYPKAVVKTTPLKTDFTIHQLADELLLEMALEAQERPLAKALHEKDLLLKKTQEDLKEANLILKQKETLLANALNSAQIAEKEPDSRLKVEILEAIAPLELELEEVRTINKQLHTKNNELLQSVESLEKKIQTNLKEFKQGILQAKAKVVEITGNAASERESSERLITSLEEKIRVLSTENQALAQENRQLIAERYETSDYLSGEETRSRPSSVCGSSIGEKQNASGPSPTEFVSDPLETDLQDKLAVYKDFFTQIRSNLQDFESSDHQDTPAFLKTLKRLVNQDHISN